MCLCACVGVCGFFSCVELEASWYNYSHEVFGSFAMIFMVVSSMRMAMMVTMVTVVVAVMMTVVMTVVMTVWMVVVMVTSLRGVLII